MTTDLLITVVCAPGDWAQTLARLQAHHPDTLDDSDAGETPAALMRGVEFDGYPPFFPLIPEGMRVAMWSSADGGFGINYEEMEELGRLWPDGARAPGYPETGRLDRFLGEPEVFDSPEAAWAAIDERKATRRKARLERKARLAQTLLNDDGSVTPAPDLPSGLLTPSPEDL